MDYKRIVEKLENREELTKEEELAAQLALVHLPIPYRTRKNVINHLLKLVKKEEDFKKQKALDADSCMMGQGPMDAFRKAQLAIKYARKIIEAKGCPESGCITHDSEGWRIISNKTGKKWPQKYETREKAENALKAYHAASIEIETLQKQAKEPDKPKKVTEIADAIRRDNPDTSDEQAYRMAWETYCSYTNPSYEGCTSKGKSKRKSPKSEY